MNILTNLNNSSNLVFRILILFALIASLISVATFVVEAAPEATSITVETITWGSASSGSVEINITTDDGIAATSFDIDFDPTVVTFVGGDPAPIVVPNPPFPPAVYPGTGECNVSEDDGVAPDTISCNGVWVDTDEPNLGFSGTSLFYTLNFSRLGIEKQASRADDNSDVIYTIDVTNKDGVSSTLDWDESTSIVADFDGIVVPHTATDGAINGAIATAFDVSTFDPFPAPPITSVDCGSADMFDATTLFDTQTIAGGVTFTYTCIGVVPPGTPNDDLGNTAQAWDSTDPFPPDAPSEVRDSVAPEDFTAIELASFEAVLGTDGNVVISWETAAEIDNAGFNVYRSVTSDATDLTVDAVRVNESLIAAQGSLGQGASYEIEDSAVPNGTWYYFLEDVDTRGQTTIHGPVSVETQAPTSAALTDLSGISSNNALLPILLLSMLAIGSLAYAQNRKKKASD